ncbi:MAG: hypothetical protein AAF368_09600, partial [Planctomycetota bacterium]
MPDLSVLLVWVRAAAGLLVLLFSFMPRASAQVLRYSFDGTVSTVQVNGADAWDSVAVGEAIHVEFQLPSDAAPSTVLVKDAEYLDVMNGFLVTIGGLAEGTADSGDLSVKDDDIFNSSCTDRLTWTVRGAPGASSPFDSLSLSLSAVAGSANCPSLVGSLDLPLALGQVPSPSQNAMNFTLFGQVLGGGFGVVIEGTVTLTSVFEDFLSSCFGDGGVSPGCTPCPCGNDAFAGSQGGCTNSFASSAQLELSGLPSLTRDSLTASLSGATGSSFAILTSGGALAPTNAANPCFGTGSGIGALSLDGLRCA